MRILANNLKYSQTVQHFYSEIPLVKSIKKRHDRQREINKMHVILYCPIGYIPNNSQSMCLLNIPPLILKKYFLDFVFIENFIVDAAGIFK